MYIVAPLVGAWIEITSSVWLAVFECVAPLVGAWIEIFAPFTPVTGVPVAPLVGAWIEILLPTNIAPTGDLSLLSWERGLK